MWFVHTRGDGGALGVGSATLPKVRQKGRAGLIQENVGWLDVEVQHIPDVGMVKTHQQIKTQENGVRGRE